MNIVNVSDKDKLKIEKSYKVTKVNGAYYRMKKPWAFPLLRWAGSKRQILSILIKNIPHNHKLYIEPFCGSASLFFALHPQSAILADINSELIYCYDILRKHPRLLFRHVQRIPNTESAYYKLREKMPSTLEPIARAGRFIYLNRYCFNGVYRTNKKGEFNVPRGTRTGDLPCEAMFYQCSYALRNALTYAVDFEECLSCVKKNDIVYLDPPYASSDKPMIMEYGPNSFQQKDIKRLVNSLFEIDVKGATFILSYSNSKELVDQIDQNWSISKIRVRRYVAGFAKHRESVQEVLISNRELN